MAYYVTDCITGIIEGVPKYRSLEKAREALKKIIGEDCKENTLWIIVDDDGNEYE